MTTKLTLVMEADVIQSAKQYAKEHGTSVSKLVESYISLVSSDTPHDENLSMKKGPITSSLSGAVKSLAEDESQLSGRELVQKAKAERFG
jgi:hypothetical protein